MTTKTTPPADFPALLKERAEAHLALKDAKQRYEAVRTELDTARARNGDASKAVSAWLESQVDGEIARQTVGDGA